MLSIIIENLTIAIDFWDDLLVVSSPCVVLRISKMKNEL